MKKTILLLLIVFIIGCSKNNDPFQNVDFGKINYKEFKSKMIEQGIFTEMNEDSTSFRYEIVNGLKKYPTEVYINSKNYRFGKLRNIYINLNGDSLELYNGQKSFLRGSGSRLKSEIDDIYDLYCKWYGKPDSISIEPNRYRNLNLLESMYDTGAKTLDTSISPTSSYWYKDKFDLKFYKTYPEKKLNYDSLKLYSSGSFISYEMKNYNNRIKEIKDSIRKTFTPNDLVEMRVYNPEWVELTKKYYNDFDTNFEIRFSDFRRKDREEPRAVVELRFDIIIADRFDKELVRIEDITFEPSEPLYPIIGGIVMTQYSPMIYSQKYSKNSDFAIDYEKARNYAKNNKVKAYAEIKAVVFKDGEILK